jgi:hypothetical protein
MEILRVRMPTGKRIPVQEIHDIVKNNFPLTAGDWASHPSEVRRGNRYPAYKRKVQAALHTMKTKEKVKHFPATEEYGFSSSSFD